MEYNKDEAQRAFDIAVAKIVAQDLAAAKKFAGKAQQLYPSLEGLSQMNAVLGVYMAAENKVNGQTDWYGILQVDLAADEAHIKKQYRKLALLLHPDKNKCAGAEGAFKLIGEAWGVLSDRAKRSLYDHKRSTAVQNFTIQKAQNNGYGFAKQNAAAGGTFWTSCPTCKMQYEYPRVYVNHNLQCPNCSNPYMAFEIPGLHRNGVRVSAGFRSGTGSGGFSGMTGGATNPNVNVGVANANSAAAQNNQRTNAAPRASNGASKAKNGNNTPKRKEEAPFKNSNAKEKKSRRKKSRTEEFDSDEVIHADEVSLSEDEEDGDQDDCEDVTEGTASKPTKNRKHDHNNKEGTASKSKKRAVQKDIGTDADADGNAGEDDDGDGEDSEDDKPSKIDVPDPDFHNFDDERTPACFEVDQIWAVYDDLDGMPRFYARIQKVISYSEENFKVKMNWLEASVKDNRAVRRWLKAGFYQGCGDFRVGKAHKNDTPLNTFSHAVACEKGPNGIIRIIPRRGEVWALYREWDSSWNESTPDEVVHKYEMVEISIECDEEVGVGVTSLVKVDGFKCLFQRTEVAREIPKSEFLRFSHQVPAKKLSGNEALNLPENCWELDPAATPVSR